MSDVRTGFGANTVLHGISLDVQDGEILAVLGLNGAGKSVAMKVAGGIVPAWSGQVRFAGHDVTRAGVEERVALGMAHVPQGRQLFPDLTVEENLRLGAFLLRRSDPAFYEPRLEIVFEGFPRLAERRHQRAGSLSGGEQAMLAVSRALINRPRLLLVDEPSAGLAPVVASEVFDLIGDVNLGGISVLLVEQNVPLALRIAHRIVVLQRGQVVYEARSDDVDHDALAHFLGMGRLLGTPRRSKAAQRAKPSKARPAGARR